MHKQMSAWHASGLLCFLCSHLQTNKRRTNEVLMWFGVLLLIKAMPQTWCLCKRHRTECKRCGLYRRVKVTQDGGWKHKATCCQHLFRIHNNHLKIVIIFICMIRSSHVNLIKCFSYCPVAVVRECVCALRLLNHISTSAVLCLLLLKLNAQDYSTMALWNISSSATTFLNSQCSILILIGWWMFQGFSVTLFKIKGDFCRKCYRIAILGFLNNFSVNSNHL